MFRSSDLREVWKKKPLHYIKIVNFSFPGFELDDSIFREKKLLILINYGLKIWVDHIIPENVVTLILKAGKL